MKRDKILFSNGKDLTQLWLCLEQDIRQKVSEQVKGISQKNNQEAKGNPERLGEIHSSDVDTKHYIWQENQNF